MLLCVADLGIRGSRCVRQRKSWETFYAPADEDLKLRTDATTGHALSIQSSHSQLPSSISGFCRSEATFLTIHALCLLFCTTRRTNCTKASIHGRHKHSHYLYTYLLDFGSAPHGMTLCEACKGFNFQKLLIASIG
jgi:hypothetical protein